MIPLAIGAGMIGAGLLGQMLSSKPSTRVRPANVKGMDTKSGTAALRLRALQGRESARRAGMGAAAARGGSQLGRVEAQRLASQAETSSMNEATAQQKELEQAAAAQNHQARAQAALQAQQLQQGAMQGAAERTSQMWGGLVQGGAGLGAAGIEAGGNVNAAKAGNQQPSDKRAKTGVRDGQQDTSALLEALASGTFEEIEPKVFRFKQGAADALGEDTGEQLGVMAQDMEGASPLGAALVDEMPGTGGVKGIDTGRALGAVLAAQADTSKRLKRLEELLAAAA